MIANKKYTVIVSNLIEEYGSELITMNEKFIRAIAGIQKKFLGGGTRAENFVEDFCKDVGKIGDRIMAWRDAEFGLQARQKESSTGDIDSTLQGVIGCIFPESKNSIRTPQLSPICSNKGLGDKSLSKSCLNQEEARIIYSQKSDNQSNQDKKDDVIDPIEENNSQKIYDINQQEGSNSMHPKVANHSQQGSRSNHSVKDNFIQEKKVSEHQSVQDGQESSDKVNGKYMTHVDFEQGNKSVNMSRELPGVSANGQHYVRDPHPIVSDNQGHSSRHSKCSNQNENYEFELPIDEIICHRPPHSYSPDKNVVDVNSRPQYSIVPSGANSQFGGSVRAIIDEKKNENFVETFGEYGLDCNNVDAGVTRSVRSRDSVEPQNNSQAHKSNKVSSKAQSHHENEVAIENVEECMIAQNEDVQEDEYQLDNRDDLDQPEETIKGDFRSIPPDELSRMMQYELDQVPIVDLSQENVSQKSEKGGAAYNGSKQGTISQHKSLDHLSSHNSQQKSVVNDQVIQSAALSHQQSQKSEHENQDQSPVYSQHLIQNKFKSDQDPQSLNQSNIEIPITGSNFDFIQNLELKEAFQTPYGNGNILFFFCLKIDKCLFFSNLYFIALSFAITGEKNGIIGYQEEGLRTFTINNDESVKIVPIKPSM